MKNIVYLLTALLMTASCFRASAEEFVDDIIVRGDLLLPDDSTVYEASPDKGKCGENMTWTIDENGTLIISGTGYMHNYWADFENEYPDGRRITNEMLESGYEEKRWYEYVPWFKNNNTKAVTRIKINEGVQSLSQSAFGETNIKSIVVPNTVTQIGAAVFGSNRKLKSAILPDTIENLPESTFSSCSSLSYVHFPANLKTIGPLCFHGCYALSNIYIPNSVTEIGEEAFKSCMSLKSLELPKDLKTISEQAFSFCDGLKTISLPPYLKTISKNAFNQCYSLSEIIIPDGVESIGAYAFGYTDTGKAVKNQIAYIPTSVKGIGSGAFNKTTIIYGFKDSAAEKYAKENGNEFVEVISTMYTPPDYESNKKNIYVFSDNDRINIDAEGKNIIWEDAQPFIDANGRTQIPIRAVAEALGAKVDWDDASRTATITKDDRIITIEIGNTDMKVGNETITMDTTAQIIDERTYIPVRFVGEALGMTVNWEGE